MCALCWVYIIHRKSSDAIGSRKYVVTGVGNHVLGNKLLN